MFPMCRLVRCLLVLAASIVLTAGTVPDSPLGKQSTETADLVRAQAASVAARDQLDAANRAAPAGDNPWESTVESREVMHKKATAPQAFDEAKATELTAVEKEEQAQLSNPPEQTTESTVKDHVQPYASKPAYRSAPYVVNIVAPEGLMSQTSGVQMKSANVRGAADGVDAIQAKAADFTTEIAQASEAESATSDASSIGKTEEQKAADFNRELSAATEAEVAMGGSPEDASSGGAPTFSINPQQSLSYMTGYEKTEQELKFKQQKQLAMQASVQRAIHLKAQAIADEKKTIAQQAREKVKYENARVSQAEQSYNAAKEAEASNELPPKTAAELVVEQEGDLRKARDADHAAKQRERVVEHEEAHDDGDDQKVKARLQQRKASNAQAVAAFDKHVAMEYVRHEFERRTKHKTTVKLKMAEKNRKTSRTQELMLKKSAAKESQGKTMENRQKGVAQAMLRESPQELESECRVSPWSDFGQCSRVCGGGMMLSTRRVVKMNPQRRNDCPGLARGKPCNNRACIRGDNDMGEAVGTVPQDCSSVISKCRQSKVLLSKCRAGLTKSMPSQMKANQLSHRGKKMVPKTVHEIGAEEWQPSPMEQSEIRAAVAHASQQVNPGRRMLSKQIETADCLGDWHATHSKCKAAKECSSLSTETQSLDEVDFQAPKSLFTDSKPQALPAEEKEFDNTLSHLVAGIHT